MRRCGARTSAAFRSGRAGCSTKSNCTERNLGPQVRDASVLSANFWSYIDLYDLADALVLAAQSSLPGHEVFYIASPDNVGNRPLAEMIRKYYGPGIALRPLAREDASRHLVRQGREDARLRAQALVARLSRRRRGGSRRRSSRADLPAPGTGPSRIAS